MITSNFLERPEGRLAYDLDGDGPLVVCLPGMGDLRTTYRFLVPALVDGGFRVASLDLRGHGDSDATFTSYDDEAAASDAIALIEELGGPAYLVGNSMGAGAAAIAAANRPDLVSGLVLLGAFVRDPRTSRFTKVLVRIMMWPPWARQMWKAYLPRLYAGTKPADFEAYRDRMIEAMRAPGKAKAFSRTTQTSHAPAEERLSRVRAPALIVMGSVDPDFPDPKAEAEWIGSRVDGEIVMVDDVGHYPQSQAPEVVNPAVIGFLRRLGSDA
jgi:pimeloyl-ACP methyl ester carboxylesterase